jgi:hypothetical protein
MPQVVEIDLENPMEGENPPWEKNGRRHLAQHQKHLQKQDLFLPQEKA